jgi:hypothetical protein
MYIILGIKMDIHRFDGALVNHRLPQIRNYTFTQRRSIMSTFYRDMQPHMTREQARILQLIINDDGKPSNYDYTNNLRADDLLILIGERIPLTRDFVNLFTQILEEMRTGLCPQGRAIRLYQLYNSYSDS